MPRKTTDEPGSIRKVGRPVVDTFTRPAPAWLEGKRVLL
jgi:hypothetical protein